jgi:hypothetical protein
VGPVAIADGTYSGSTAEDSFFGVLDPEGIVAIRLSNSILGPNLFGIEVDHVQFGEAGSLLHELPFVLDWEGDPLLEPVPPRPRLRSSLSSRAGALHGAVGRDPDVPPQPRRRRLRALRGDARGRARARAAGPRRSGASFASLFPGWTPADVLADPESFFEDSLVRGLVAILPGSEDVTPFTMLGFAGPEGESVGLGGGTISRIPEGGTWGLFALGLVGFLTIRRRRIRSALEA